MHESLISGNIGGEPKIAISLLEMGKQRCVETMETAKDLLHKFGVTNIVWPPACNKIRIEEDLTRLTGEDFENAQIELSQFVEEVSNEYDRLGVEVKKLRSKAALVLV